jgi:PAS domain S-box-containing protein
VLLLNGIFLSGYWQTVILLSTIWVACMSLFVQSSQFSNHYIKMPNRIYRIGWALIFIASGWVAQSYVLGQLVSKSTILLSYFLILLGVIALSLAVEVYEKVLTSTERKRQSNAISDLKRFYNIFRNSAEGLYTSNLEGKLISLNPAMSKLFGYDSEQDMLDNLPETKCLYANQEDRLRLISQVVNNGQAMDMEFEGLKKDGTRFWFSISVQFIEEEGQKVFTGSIIDVTDRRKFQHNLEYKRCTCYITLFGFRPI